MKKNKKWILIFFFSWLSYNLAQNSPQKQVKDVPVNEACTRVDSEIINQAIALSQKHDLNDDEAIKLTLLDQKIIKIYLDRSICPNNEIFQNYLRENQIDLNLMSSSPRGLLRRKWSGQSRGKLSRKLKDFIKREKICELPEIRQYNQLMSSTKPLNSQEQEALLSMEENLVRRAFVSEHGLLCGDDEELAPNPIFTYRQTAKSYVEKNEIEPGRLIWKRYKNKFFKGSERPLKVRIINQTFNDIGSVVVDGIHSSGAEEVLTHVDDVVKMIKTTCLEYKEEEYRKLIVTPLKEHLAGIQSMDLDPIDYPIEEDRENILKNQQKGLKAIKEAAYQYCKLSL